MPDRTARGGVKERGRNGARSGATEQERKKSVQKHGRSTMVRSIASAIVIKSGDLFFVFEPDGGVPCGEPHGSGLYYHDCRYLKGYEMKVGRAKLNSLVATAEDGYRAVVELTNPEMHLAGGAHITAETIGIKWERLIDAEKCALHDVITFHNYSHDDVKLEVSLKFDAGFEDVFAVRSISDELPGTLRKPAWAGNTLELAYDGKDNVTRRTQIVVSPEPDERGDSDATTTVSLAAQQKERISVSIFVREEDSGASTDRAGAPAPKSDIKRVRQRLQEDAAQWMDEHASVTTDNPFLQRAMARSLGDLWLLKTELEGTRYFSGGVPWFVALFGRDSIISALQTLAFDPGMAESTLRLLARYQGEHVDDWRDEQPGKILHELRVGEMAHLNEIPQTPYYGSIDSTPLFLILLARHAAWTGSLQLFEELRDNVERALRWIAEYGDVADNGYTAYASTSKQGLSNQGWKDSGDAIVNTDGSMATPPIALVEVQGYVFRAKREIAALFRRAGDTSRADQLEQEADVLRAQFERDFWMEGEDIYALALQRDGSQVAVVSSNPGQALWTGIAGDERGRRTGQRLMRDDMFNGWGVRTLSASSSSYNPVGYHLGTVWPHDNSIIAAGLRRYGLDDDARRIFAGILDASTHFSEYRLPEVFAGFGRSEYEVPVRYPVACHPQAWAAGSVPFLLETLLGLQPDAFAGTLQLVRPVLPPSTARIDLRRLRVGAACVDLHLERRDGAVVVETSNLHGELRVEAEGATVVEG